MTNRTVDMEATLEALAAAWGIETEYVDNWGEVHYTSRATKRALLSAMGVSIDEEPAVEITSPGKGQDSGWGPFCRRNLVVNRNALPETFVFRLPKDRPLRGSASVTLYLEYEDGSREAFSYALTELNRLQAEDEVKPAFRHWELPFPRIEKIGYYTLHLHVESVGEQMSQQVFVTVCPHKAYLPPELSGAGRMAGISLSLYGVRSKRNWGVGDFTDLKAVIDWSAEDLGVNVIGVNPLHAGYNRSPYNRSPYLPISKFYHNYIYLDVEAVREYRQSRAARDWVATGEVQNELSALRGSKQVEYERVAALKQKVLWVCFQDFFEGQIEAAGRQTVREKEFQNYIEREGEALERFALFCALDDVMRDEDRGIWTWWEWPEAYRHPDNQKVRRFRKTHEREVLFHKYLQWQLHQQLADAQAHALKRKMSIGLYHDLALAIDNCGADAWGYPDYFYPRLRVGAPPDAFAQHGQDWGFPPPNMEQIARSGYDFFIREIRRNCRFGGALRMDHVMRLFHLYCIPEGESPENGAYISQPHEDLLKILLLESVRNRVVIIGEDLGTVPDYIRHRLNEANVLSYRLLYFEKDKDQEFLPPAEYPDMALVTVSTHDLPTLAGFWSSRDISLRERLGMFQSPEAAARAREERLRDKRKLLRLAQANGMVCPDEEAHLGEALTGDCHNAFVGLLAVTPSKLFVLSQEDLLKEDRQQNVPGTTNEYPNWSIKMKYTVEELGTDPMALACSRMFRRWVETSGRTGKDGGQEA